MAGAAAQKRIGEIVAFRDSREHFLNFNSFRHIELALIKC
jgi:hypothetical protein